MFMCYLHLPEEVADQVDCVYFLRNTPGMVPLPNSMEEANETLPAYFEMGTINSNSVLVMLEQIISQVNSLYKFVLTVANILRLPVVQKSLVFSFSD